MQVLDRVIEKEDSKLKNLLLLRAISALAVVLAIAGAPGIGYAANPPALSLPTAGLGSVVLVNQDGGNEALSVNFGGTNFTVPPQGSASPNQVQFNIAPGTYSYVASVGGVGSVNGTVTVPQGRVLSLAFIDNSADLAAADQNGDDRAVVVQQVVSNNNEDENNEDSDNDNENEGEGENVQNVENNGNQEVNESSETEGSEGDIVSRNDDGIREHSAGVESTTTTTTSSNGTTTTTPTTTNANAAVDPPAKGTTTTDPAKGTTTTDSGKSKIVVPDVGKVTTTTDAGKSKIETVKPFVPTISGDPKVTTQGDGGKSKIETVKPFVPTISGDPKVTTNVESGKGKIIVPTVKPFTVPVNPGRENNFSAGRGEFNGATNHFSKNNSTINGCVPGSPLFATCGGAGGSGGSGGNGKSSGKRSDFLTVSFTPPDNGATFVVANDGHHDKDSSDDGDNEGNEGNGTSVVNITQPAVDNDELIVTITDVTAQAQ